MMWCGFKLTLHSVQVVVFFLTALKAHFLWRCRHNSVCVSIRDQRQLNKVITGKKNMKLWLDTMETLNWKKWWSWLFGTNSEVLHYSYYINMHMGWDGCMVLGSLSDYKHLLWNASSLLICFPSLLLVRLMRWFVVVAEMLRCYFSFKHLVSLLLDVIHCHHIFKHGIQFFI